MSVLASQLPPCGSLAASTCPVPASAMTNAEACTLGNRGAPGAALTITPRPDNSDPPMACGALAVAGTPADEAVAGAPEGPPEAAAGAATAASASRAPAAASAARRGTRSASSANSIWVEHPTSK